MTAEEVDCELEGGWGMGLMTPALHPHPPTPNPPLYRDTTRSTVVIWVKKNQNELMVEIYSKGLVRAIGKVLRMKFRYNTN